MAQLQHKTDFLKAMGRGGDDTVAHLDTGEFVIPKSVVTPRLMEAFLEAMDTKGLNPGDYTVGQGNVNPRTGMQEFLEPGSSEGGPTGGPNAGADAGDPADGPSGPDGFDSGAGRGSPASRGGPEAGGEVSGPGGGFGAIEGFGGLLTGIGEAITGQPATGQFGGLNTDPLGLGSDTKGGGDVIRDTLAPIEETAVVDETAFTRPDALALPSFIDASLSPLQQRSLIATEGTQGDTSTFTSDEATNYYFNLLQREFIGDTGDLADLSLLPVEQQYLEQVYNITDTADTTSLLNAIAAL